MGRMTVKPDQDKSCEDGFEGQAPDYITQKSERVPT